jgi:hypothetical protein
MKFSAISISFVFTFLIQFNVFCKSNGQSVRRPDIRECGDNIESMFRTPPSSARPHTWWHWMNGNISKVGITTDLEAMKKMGIGGATIFNVSYKIPSGNVSFMSKEWRDLFKHAVNEADRLGIELGVHNCEGWSVSGGPWIPVDQSMQKLTSSHVVVRGPRKVSLNLPMPEITKKSTGWITSHPIDPFYRDISVIAMKIPEGELQSMHDAYPTISGNTEGVDYAKLLDGDVNSGIKLPRATPDRPQIIELDMKSPYTARTLLLNTWSGQTHLSDQGHEGELHTSYDGKNFTKVTSFAIVSDEHHGRLALPIPVTTSRFWRIVFTKANPRARDMRIAEIDLQQGVRIGDWPEKAGFIRSRNDMGNPENTHYSSKGIIPENEILDITDQMDSSGRLLWDVPEGTWKILRIGHTSTGKENHWATTEILSLESDKMNPYAVKTHYDSFIGELVKEVGPLTGKTFKHVLVDSWEAGVQNWTPEFIYEFKKRRGYDPIPFLPATFGYIVNSHEISERFLWDFRRTIADLIADNHALKMKKMANSDGLSLAIEAYGPNRNFDNFQVAIRSDQPMTEFWFGRKGREGLGKHASSAAHAMGLKVTGAEAFTANAQFAGWKDHPYAMKATGDLMFSSGVNRMVLHSWVHQPWPDLKPGLTFGPFGININKNTTWFKQGKAWIDYLTRCQYMLQEGQFMADIAIFTGEHAPNNGGQRDPASEIPPGYDYDYMNAEVLATAYVKNGRITLPSGMSYRLLILRNSTSLTPELTRKIKDLIAEGALVSGQKPEKSPGLTGYPHCDDDVSKYASMAWGNVDGISITKNSYGKGRVYDGLSIADILNTECISPAIKNLNGNIAWQHRKIDNSEVFFISSQTADYTSPELSFRIKGYIPEFWYPDDGTIKRAGVWRQENGRTIVPLELDPYGSMFVVFRKKGKPEVTALSGNGYIRHSAEKMELVAHENGCFEITTKNGKHNIRVESVPSSSNLSGPWTVKFAPLMGAPDMIELDSLISWTQHPDDSVKFYSGTAIYETDFEVPTAMKEKNKIITLDLGQVSVIAEVVVNDLPVGVLWKPPFKTDITRFVQAGRNKLKISITNTWANRLIGDEHQPTSMSWQKHPGEGFALKNWPQWFSEGKQMPEPGRFTFTTWRHYEKSSSLMPSGLIGPVVIRCASVIQTEI